MNIFTESGNEGAPLLISSPDVDVISYTGSTAVEDRLKKHGIPATPEQVKEVVGMIKDLAESRSKEEQAAFIHVYREREEKRRGVSDAEFWGIAKKAGLTPPPEFR